uniref:7TM GPCR serpentine receptor class x (Srx) domain-containing protein n=1 Tax=Ditylenchus dipsaci TaxID=166011 RepID=A0A915E6Q7_9BILA
MIFTTGQAQAYFNIFGVVYCSDPLATTLAGTIGMVMWYYETTMSVLLALNRYLILTTSKFSYAFSNNKVYGWIVGVFVSSVVMTWFTPTMVFSGVAGGYIADPHVGYLPQDDYVS